VADVPPEALDVAAGVVLAAADLIGCADAPPVSPPLAVMAAAASTGALPVMMMRAMVNRNVDVRFSDRERIKVIFQSGTSFTCSPFTRA
jgi:hypothetical protein